MKRIKYSCSTFTFPPENLNQTSDAKVKPSKKPCQGEPTIVTDAQKLVTGGSTIYTDPEKIHTGPKKLLTKGQKM